MNRSNTNLFAVAPFTMLALAANLALYGLCVARSNNLMHIDMDVLNTFGASQREGLWSGDWLRLIAPMFLHGGMLHIFFNLSFLWQAGPDAEKYFGTPNYGTIYLLSGAAGFCLSQMFGGHFSIGASGSLCGIMGAHLAVLILKCPVPANAWRNSQVRMETYGLLFWLGIGLLGVMNMDNWAHFGGMIVGLALGASFELWSRRNGLGRVGAIMTLIACAALICAARWTVFNPTYQVFMAASATEENHDPAAAKMHADEARKWAKTWTPLHFLGVLNVDETNAILHAYELGYWTRENAFDPTCMMVTIRTLYKDGDLSIRLAQPKKRELSTDSGSF